MTPLEEAFPLSSNWVAATVRSKLAEQSIFCTDDPDLSGEDFSVQPYAAVAVFGPDGDLELYAFDAGDTTTADDGGVSCIVVSGRRYKKRAEVIVRDSALSATTTAQPGSPALGDTYIVPAAPSGADWAGQAETVAVYTARGWLFRQPFVGMIVYVEDDASFWHYGASGDWSAGLPIGVIPDGGIAPRKLAEPFAILKVVDQRNAPPGSAPTAGTMYQVGTSPTGAFSGHPNEVARYNGLAYEFLVPAEGDTIYRLDQATLYSYRSGVWVRTVLQPGVSQVFYTTNTGSTGTINTATPANLVSQSITVPAGSGTHVKVDLTFFTGTYSQAANTTIEFGIRVDTASTLAFVGKTINYPTGPVSVLGNGGAGSPMGLLFNSDTPVIHRDGYLGVSFIAPVPDSSAHTYSVSMRRSVGAAAVSVTSFAIGAVFSVVNAP
jgi:hypothetical protein